MLALTLRSLHVLHLGDLVARRFAFDTSMLILYGSVAVLQCYTDEYTAAKPGSSDAL